MGNGKDSFQGKVSFRGKRTFLGNGRWGTGRGRGFRAGRILAFVTACVLMACSLAGCGGEEGPAWRSKEVQILDDNYRTWYEVFVYSFCDSDGDRIGDLQGVISKLDYIADMGFNGIWLMPIMPSPSYHKYDVTDYEEIDPLYGDMEDFDRLVEE